MKHTNFAWRFEPFLVFHDFWFVKPWFLLVKLHFYVDSSRMFGWFNPFFCFPGGFSSRSPPLHQARWAGPRRLRRAAPARDGRWGRSRCWRRQKAGRDMGDLGLKMRSGWWFGTFFVFPYIGNNHPNWLIFFRGVQTTNQMRYMGVSSNGGTPKWMVYNGKSI